MQRFPSGIYCRKLPQCISPPSSRSLSLTSRNKPITRDDLFTYTNGRFLINESHARARRYMRFDIDELCAVAASTSGSFSRIQSIEKLEGGFSKALLMRREDGNQVVAKVPFRIAGPPKYTTASEVAVLEFLRMKTKVPVPRVLAWSSDASNPVGAEYIVTEKAAGVQLFKAWGDMSDYDRFELVQRITELEGELATVRFPASGSLYLRESLSEDETRVKLSSDVDPSGRFCIGPSCERQWSIQSEQGTMVSHPEFNRGPWPDIVSLGMAIVEREISRIKHGKAKMISGLPSISTEEQLTVLNMVKDVMCRLNTGTLIDRFSQPVLWHTDLHMGNIFVSASDPTKITSLIDWQSISISPLLLQVRFPEFLSVDADFVLDAPMAQLPNDYETLDAVEKQIVEMKTRLAKMAKVYEVATSVHNTQAYNTLLMPSFFRHLFLLHKSSEEASGENIIPLRVSLIQLAEEWDEIGFKEPCPFSFTEAEIEKYIQEFRHYSNVRGIEELARKLLDTDSEGWISPQLNFEMKVQQNKELRDEFMRRSREYDMSEEQVRRIWPF